jgi:hypothetical protein
MMVAQTSIIAYNEHRASGKVGSQAMHIFDAMQFNKGYSRRELVKITGLELSSVCGRVNEMLQIGMLQESAPRKCSITNKTIKPVIKESLF